jgi:hypothetical protein
MPSLWNQAMRVHRGISVRVSAGLGYGVMKRRVTDSSSYKVRGLEGQLSLDIGASVIDNLIVFGRFSGFAWNSMFVTDSANAGGAYLGLLGAGARYYLMPANVFGSAALGVAAIQVLNDLGVSQNAYPGFGLELEAGKDFWAGTPLDQRGTGLSLRFGFVHCGSVQHTGADLKPWNSYSISVLFSAAYN